MEETLSEKITVERMKELMCDEAGYTTVGGSGCDKDNISYGASDDGIIEIVTTEINDIVRHFIGKLRDALQESDDPDKTLCDMAGGSLI